MDDLDNVLTRGVEKILPDKDSLRVLMGKRRIKLYCGYDPTANSLHVGHFISIRKLAQFQKLGHKVIFLVGDFTAMIGDPTDKGAARKKLTKKEVLNNLKDYKSQAGKILRFEGENAAEIKFNSQWLSKLTFEDIVELSSNFTVQQLIERDFFQERLQAKKPIYLHEFLYPLMQGYDSVAMNVDLEIGGSDQLFNMLAGRTLMTQTKRKEKFVLTLKLLTDPSGKKMGKTDNNAIFLNDSPSEIYAKIMSFPDSLITPMTELLTDLSVPEIEGMDAMEAKKKIAFEVVSQVHSQDDAKSAENYFEKNFQSKNPEYNTVVSPIETLEKTIAQLPSVDSISQAKRLISQGAVDVNDKNVTDPELKIKVGDKIKVGKKIFAIVK